MKSIVLYSTDDCLAQRISVSLGASEEIVRLPPGARDGLRPVMRQHAMIVLDCRDTSRTQTTAALLNARAELTVPVRVVALTSLASRGALEILGRSGVHDLDVVLADCDHVGGLLRAMLNDADGPMPGAVALNALRPHIATNAFRVAECVLTSACRLHTVGRVANRLGADRTTVERWLRPEGAPSPKIVIRLARTAFATVLLRRTALSVAAVARRTRFSAARWLQCALEIEFGLRALQIRGHLPTISSEEFLAHMMNR